MLRTPTNAERTAGIDTDLAALKFAGAYCLLIDAAATTSPCDACTR
jgi:hypothetical protein